eukprot:3107752-Rhodomonas_salina.1
MMTRTGQVVQHPPSRPAGLEPMGSTVAVSAASYHLQAVPHHGGQSIKGYTLPPSPVLRLHGSSQARGGRAQPVKKQGGSRSPHMEDGLQPLT